MTREDVIAYLRWLADQQGGIPHRDVLFRAALMLARDHSTIFVPQQERHGDQSI